MAVIFPNPTIEDLKLTFQESGLVRPLQPNPPRSLYLSNIDQILNYTIPTAFFFTHNPDFPPEGGVVVDRLRTALQKVLLTYDFMAGRLKLDPQSSRLEINCNAAGAGFVVASSDLTLAQLGDLVCPNPAFRQLAPQTLEDLQPDDQPLFILQVTSFKCGGFALGMSVNHITLDGISAKTFKENLASQVFEGDRPLAVNPCLDRRLLSARSPTLVEFPHPEFFIPEAAPDSSGPPVFDCKREELEFRVFRLTPADINFLKDKASKKAAPSSADDHDQEACKHLNPPKISSYSVVTALIWRCKALSLADPSDSSKVSTLLNVVDIRSRLNPPLPASYCGNGVLVAYASAECGEMEKVPLGELAARVWEGPKRIGDAYARSAIDWLEVNRGLPCGEYMVSSWLRLGFEELEFPWGKPIHCGPVVNHRKDICWVFPTPGGTINALVALPPNQIERFQTHFLNSFAS